MLRYLTPFSKVTKRTLGAITVAHVAFALLAWLVLSQDSLLPTPAEVIGSYSKLLKQGLVYELAVSVKTLALSLALSTLIAGVISALATVPLVTPISKFASALRFLGFAGLTFIFTMWASSAFELKVMLLTFGMSVYQVTSMLAEVETVKQEELDYVATLGMGPWRSLLELVLIGRFHVILDTVRQNAAVGWTLLAMVEGITRSQGGIGAMLLVENKFINLTNVFAIQVVIFTYGFVQDVALGQAKAWLCPWSKAR